LVLSPVPSYYPAVRYGHLSVAFDPGDFDFTAYLPHLAGETWRFIELGFGVFFENPPKHVRLRGSLAEESGRKYWAALKESDWSQIGKDLEFRR
jgi:hypothetical protein